MVAGPVGFTSLDQGALARGLCDANKRVATTAGNVDVERRHTWTCHTSDGWFTANRHFLMLPRPGSSWFPKPLEASRRPMQHELTLVADNTQ